MKNVFQILLAAILFSSCQSNQTPLPLIEVDADFVKYVDAFIEEAAKRGIEIDFSDTGLQIGYGEIAGANATCSEVAGHDWGSHRIIINEAAWQNLNDTLRERLIFHEIGHCELNREHLNDKFEDGSWRSIMRGAPLTAEEEKLPIPYFGFRRAYYIDELFDQHTILPEWANQQFHYDELSVASKVVVIDQVDLDRLDDTTNLALENYELEFELRTVAGTDATWVAWGMEAQHYFIWFKDQEFHFAANSSYQGPFHYQSDEQLDFRDMHKVTIRQEGPYCKVFLNETFFFMVDRLPADLFFVLSSPENEIEFDSYTISEILQ